MGRQGKMHSSPFHVESAQYKYAIEHESEHYAIRSEPINCINCSRGGKHCNLWNIKHSICTPHRCSYYRKDLRRANVCSDCAYSYEKRCFHPKRPIRSRFYANEAKYCCYFQGLEAGKKYFCEIRNFCKRIVLTELVEKYKKKVYSKNLYIRQAKEELSNPKTSADDKAYLKAKIRSEAIKRSDARKLFEQYRSELSTIGGELKSMPTRNLYCKK